MSKEDIIPLFGLWVLKISISSFVDLMVSLWERYVVNRSLIGFVSWQVGVVTCEIIGRSE